MVNPPTFNDLKRSRNINNLLQKRSKIIGIGKPVIFDIPSLTVPNFTFNFLGINSNYVASGDEIGTFNGDQLDFLNLNKFIDYPVFEFYNNYRFITTTDYLFDSLYFINNTYIQKSINFNDVIDNIGENTFKREFYNYDSEIESQTVILTTYDFSNLQVNLSTNIDGFTGTNDDGTFTIEVSAVHENGRLLENFVNYSVQDKNNTSLATFNTLSTFNYIVPISLNAPFIDENYTLTLSTSRFDSVTGLYESTKSLSINISAAPYTDALVNSIHTTWTTISSLSNPLDEYPTLSGVHIYDTDASRATIESGTGKFFYQQEFFRPNADQHFDDALDNATNEAIRTKYRYVNNRTTDTPTWNTAWFLYPYRDIYDLSGVSFKGESPLAGDDNSTLIAGKFGVTNSHFSSKPVGTTIKFLDRDNNLLTTTIVGRKDLGQDCRLEKYEHDLTTLSGGNIKLYRLPRITSDIKRQKVFPAFYQSGNYSLGKLRNPDFTGSFSYSQGDEFAAFGSTYFLRGTLSGTANIFVDYTSLQSVSSVFENKKLGLPQRSLGSGDSSSPAFLIYNNEILLLTTFNFTTTNYIGGWRGGGPGYHTQGFHDRINAGMDALGREGYQLSAVQID